MKPAIHRTTPKPKATSKASQPSVHPRASPALSILPAPGKIRAPIPIQRCPTSRAPPLAFILTWFGRQAVTGLTVSTICSHPGLGSYKQALMTSIPRHQSDRSCSGVRCTSRGQRRLRTTDIPLSDPVAPSPIQLAHPLRNSLRITVLLLRPTITDNTCTTPFGSRAAPRSPARLSPHSAITPAQTADG